MSQLPFESDTFEVVCRLGLLTGDGADSDTAPDVVTSPGTVMVTAILNGSPLKTLVYTEWDDHYRIIQVRGLTYSIDRYTGALLASDGRKISLYKSTSPNIKPNGFTYLATISIENGVTITVPFDDTPTHPDGTVDLGALIGVVR